MLHATAPYEDADTCHDAMQGAICLDTLSSGWSPVQTIKTALLSIRMLLEVPNPKDPQDAEVASMLKDDPPLFARTAHHWAVKYAGATPQTTEYKEYQASAKPVATPEEDLKRCVLPKENARALGVLSWPPAC